MGVYPLEYEKKGKKRGKLSVIKRSQILFFRLNRFAD